MKLTERVVILSAAKDLTQTVPCCPGATELSSIAVNGRFQIKSSPKNA